MIFTMHPLVDVQNVFEERDSVRKYPCPFKETSQTGAGSKMDNTVGSDYKVPRQPRRDPDPLHWCRGPPYEQCFVGGAL